MIPISALSAFIYNDLKKAGKLIGIPDILIAGVCMARKQPLLTRNRDHFSRISGLKLPKGV
jgi:tRNA(fMet)-specific endonuclease VapC